MDLPRYEQVRLLGEGGFGRVYEAVWRGPGGFSRRVALKLVADGTGLRREARLGGLLRHPNLVDVYEVGEHEGTWFLAMEFCRDGTLAGRAPLPPRAVVEVGLQVCEALAYAHDELGLGHLDLKPQNLLLDGATVKVADLGVATAREAGPRRRIEGTPGYMAPEQRLGLAVDARTDVFALGVVLHELATGQRPTLGSATVSLDDPEDDGPVERTAPPWLAPVLDRCLAPDPADRFASMRELARALRRVEAEGASLVVALGLPTAEPARPAEEPAPPLVGRARELSELAEALRRPGLVTLKGPPGIGKSALAHAAAQGFERAWTCRLTGSPDRAALVAAVARALEVPLVGDELAAQVGRALDARGEALLVLDDAEALAGHADLVAGWLAAAPRARVLVATRVPLRLEGERVVEVDALAPEAATELLRVLALRRGVQLGDDPRVAELVRRVDGVPLAIELAAGRLGVLPLGEVLERLSLSLLRSGRSGATEREATLQGALAFSTELLDVAVRSALAQLSVFRGPFTLLAAADVLELPDGVEVADVVQDLLDRSLLVARGERLVMLSPVRAHARLLLGDAAEAKRRHGEHFARAGTDEALALLDTHGGVERRRALGPDRDDLVIACRRAVRRGDGVVAARTALAAAALLESTGPVSLAVELCEGVLGLDGLSEGLRGRVEIAAGSAWRARGRPEARARLEAAVTRFRALGDRRWEGHALVRLANALDEVGVAAEALAAAVAAEGCAREVGDRRLLGLALGRRGVIAYEQGRADEALACCEAALALHREVGARSEEARTLGNLGVIRFERGERELARGHQELALATHRETGDRRLEAVALDNLGTVHASEGRHDEARLCYEAALETLRRAGDRRHQGVVLGNLGNLAFYAGDLPGAERWYEEALAVHREVGNRRFEGTTLCNLANVRADLGFGGVEALYREAIRIHREIGSRRSESYALRQLAVLLAQLDRNDEARGCLREAQAIAEGIGDLRQAERARAALAQLDG